MLQMNKETLKDLLYEEIKELILYYDSEAFGKEDFKFEFSQDKNTIIFKCVTEVIYGNDCWDSKEEKRTTSLSHVDYYQLNQIIDRLVIDHHELNKYNITSDKDLHEYYITDSLGFYYHEDTERINEDYYYNHDILRTIDIPIDEIAQALIDFKYTKPLSDFLDNFEYLGRSAKDKYVEIEAKNNPNTHIEIKEATSIKRKM